MPAANDSGLEREEAEHEEEEEEEQRSAKRTKPRALPPTKKKMPPDGYQVFDLSTPAGKKRSHDWVRKTLLRIKKMQNELFRRSGVDSNFLVVLKGEVVPNSPDSSLESSSTPSLSLRHVLTFLNPDFQADRLAEEEACFQARSSVPLLTAPPSASPSSVSSSATSSPQAQHSQLNTAFSTQLIITPSSSQVVFSTSTMKKEVGQWFVQQLRCHWQDSLDAMFRFSGALGGIFPNGTISGVENKRKEGERNKNFPASSIWTQEKCILLLNRLLDKDALSENFKQSGLQDLLASMKRKIAVLAATTFVHVAPGLAASFTEEYHRVVNVFAEKWGPFE